MKKMIGVAGCMLLLAACAGQRADRYGGFEQEMFRNPENTFRSVPFYSLNDSLDADELDRQLTLMKEAGLGGAFLHSRIGLLTPFLSEEWFKMMREGVNTCQRIGIDAWFYDEDLWPSGYAGGAVPRLGDEYHARRLVRLDKSVALGDSDVLICQRGRYNYVSQKFPWGRGLFGTAWVDLMNPKVGKAFIDYAYRPYVERFKNELNVKGVFSDEPNIFPFEAPAVPGPMVTYSPVLDSVFEARCGYALPPVVPSLFDTVGDWRKVRLDYYRTMAYCFEQAFSKPLGDYCAEHNWIWTGHYFSEDTPAGTMLAEGAHMQQVRHMQQPGIDALGLRYNSLFCGKAVPSVANQYGRQRRLSELFGISGHNLTFEDRMWITAWHSLMGFNFMCPHLYLYSMKGVRKRDFPPTISHQQPYWKYEKLFEDYSARLCYFATCGVSEAEIVVLNPIESDYIEHTTTAFASSRDTLYEALLQRLMTTHRNTDLGDEQLIAEEGAVDGNRFVIGKMCYRMVVIPQMATIRRTTLVLLERFHRNGGHLFSYGALPRYVDGVRDTLALSRLAEWVTPLDADNLSARLDAAVRPHFTLLSSRADKVWSALRKTDNGYLVQLSNTLRKESVTLSLHFADPKTEVALWNPINGEALEMEPDGEGNYTLAFAPAQSWILSTGASVASVQFDGKYSIPSDRKELFALPNHWTGRRIEANALTLDFASASKDGGNTWEAPEPVLAHSDRLTKLRYRGPLQLRYSVQVEELPQECRLAVEQPWMYKSIMLNGEPVVFTSKDFFIDASIRTQPITSLLRKGRNEIILSLDYVPADGAAIDPVARYGTEIESIYLVGDFAVSGKLSAAQPLQSWRNMEPTLAPRPLPTSFDSFSLTREQHEFSGDLTRQGYPFFAGSFELSRSFEMPQVDSALHYKLTFPEFEAILIDVTLNGVKLPVLYAAPWEADLSGALRTGENKLTVTVTNGLRNLMGPSHHKGAEFTDVGPSVFRGGNDWPNIIEQGEADWYDARLRGTARLWRDQYFSIPFGVLQSPVLVTQKK